MHRYGKISVNKVRVLGPRQISILALQKLLTKGQTSYLATELGGVAPALWQLSVHVVGDPWLVSQTFHQVLKLSHCFGINLQINMTVVHLNFIIYFITKSYSKGEHDYNVYNSYM